MLDSFPCEEHTSIGVIGSIGIRLRVARVRTRTRGLTSPSPGSHVHRPWPLRIPQAETRSQLAASVTKERLHIISAMKIAVVFLLLLLACATAQNMGKPLFFK